jgi:hypothetical protein
MSFWTSKAQDCAEVIKRAKQAVENADKAYRKGGSLNALNKANDDLAAATNALYEVEGGVVPDERGNK